MTLILFVYVIGIAHAVSFLHNATAWVLFLRSFYGKAFGDNIHKSL
jgi:hypothetical protein